MAWAYPRHKFTYTWTLDPEEWNDNLVVFANEMNGNLNEQNIASTGATYPFMHDIIENSLCQFDVMARLFSKKTRVDPLGTTANMEEIPPTTRWFPIAASKPTTFHSRGGLALILISFQTHFPTMPSGMSGLNFAIEVDGVMRPDTLLGTGDQGNDFLDLAFGATLSGGEVDWDYGTSPSFRAIHEPKMVRGLIRLEPGQHVIRLVARNLFTVTAATAQYISNCETVVIDMWA